MSFIGRYAQDTTAPTIGEAGRDLARRTLLPAVGLWAVIVAIGFLIKVPLRDLPAEDAVNQSLATIRTPFLNVATQVWSNIGGTHFIIYATAATMALIWWRTRQWWYAVVPGIAVAVQSAVFLTSSLLVGRGRPDVEPLDVAPPTSSYPSGHTGASTAFYLTLALIAQRIRNPLLRVLATIGCLMVPVLVAFARLYRGMHQPTDVAVGLVNGVTCAWLAWRYLRRRDDGTIEAPSDGTLASRA